MSIETQEILVRCIVTLSVMIVVWSWVKSPILTFASQKLLKAGQVRLAMRLRPKDSDCGGSCDCSGVSKKPG